MLLSPTLVGKFVVRSAEDWTSGYNGWRRGGPASKASDPAQAAPPPSPLAAVFPSPPARPPPAPPPSYPVASPPERVSHLVAPFSSVSATSLLPGFVMSAPVAEATSLLLAAGGGQQMPRAPQPDGFAASAMPTRFVSPTAKILRQHNWLQSLKVSGAQFWLNV